jgi:hypothetical protein
MPREKRPKQVPKRAKEAADPDPDMTPMSPKSRRGTPLLDWSNPESRARTRRSARSSRS